MYPDKVFNAPDSNRIKTDLFTEITMSKNKNRHQTRSLRTMSHEELKRFAAENLEKGKLRIARDAFKELVRIDRDRYLPDLLRCYNLLAEQMAGSGQQKEARNLLAYIESLGGSSAVTVDMDALLAQSGSGESSLVLYARGTAGEMAVDIATALRAADAAMAGYDLPSGMPGSFTTAFEAVSDALELIGAKRFGDVSSALNCVSFSSPFSQWRLLCRGMCAFYTGDDTDALKTFGKITPATVPGRLAHSFLAIMDHRSHLAGNDSDRVRLWM